MAFQNQKSVFGITGGQFIKLKLSWSFTACKLKNKLKSGKYTMKKNQLLIEVNFPKNEMKTKKTTILEKTDKFDYIKIEGNFLFGKLR